MTKGYLFEDDREAGLRYCLFIDGLEAGDIGEEVKTLEVRFDTLWEFIDCVSHIRDELGIFNLELREPEHYTGVVEG